MLVATVARAVSRGRDVPTGVVQFMVDGEKVGTPVPLDSIGRATFKESSLPTDSRRVTASFIPSKGSSFLPSASLDRRRTVKEAPPR